MEEMETYEDKCALTIFLKKLIKNNPRNLCPDNIIVMKANDLSDDTKSEMDNSSDLGLTSTFPRTRKRCNVKKR